MLAKNTTLMVIAFVTTTIALGGGSRDNLAPKHNLPSGSKRVIEGTHYLEKITSYHKNRILKDEFMLPPEIFAEDVLNYKPVNLIGEFTSIAQEVLGYVPLISAHGSLMYTISQDGHVRWEHVDDFDLRLHIRKDLDRRVISQLTGQIKEKFLNTLKSKGVAIYHVKRDQVINLKQGGMVYPITAFWIGREKGFEVDIHLAYKELLFTETRFYWLTYSPTDFYSGDIQILNEQIEKMSSQELVSYLVEMYQGKYRRILKEWEVEDASGSYHGLKLLKLLFQLATLVGREGEFEHLLEKRHELKKKWNANELIEIFHSACRELSYKKDRLMKKISSENLHRILTNSIFEAASTEKLIAQL